ncbi:MAG: thiamine-phosphate pyrophosphorylase [bacterium]
MENENKILRIIDANVNRATEGLRVVEEICRFILEDKKLTLTIKSLRGRINKIIKTPIKVRESVKDVGRDTYIETEGKREKLEDVFQANMKRAQEAVRCLEEFSKLIDAKYGKEYKAIRFKLYTLEKKLRLRVSKA